MKKNLFLLAAILIFAGCETENEHLAQQYGDFGFTYDLSLPQFSGTITQAPPTLLTFQPVVVSEGPATASSSEPNVGSFVFVEGVPRPRPANVVAPVVVISQRPVVREAAGAAPQTAARTVAPPVAAAVPPITPFVEGSVVAAPTNDTGIFINTNTLILTNTNVVLLTNADGSVLTNTNISVITNIAVFTNTNGARVLLTNQLATNRAALNSSNQPFSANPPSLSEPPGTALGTNAPFVGEPAGTQLSTNPPFVGEPAVPPTAAPVPPVTAPVTPVNPVVPPPVQPPQTPGQIIQRPLTPFTPVQPAQSVPPVRPVVPAQGGARTTP